MRSITIAKVGSMTLLTFLLLMIATFAFPRVAQAAPRIAEGFPANATWTYIDDSFQAWIGPLEFDTVSGLHYNLHVQIAGGGNDYANYHISYKGITQDANGDNVYTWDAYESVTNTDTVYTMSTAVDESTASESILYSVADDVGNNVGDTALTDALETDSIASGIEVDGLVDVLFTLMLL